MHKLKEKKYQASLFNCWPYDQIDACPRKDSKYYNFEGLK